MAEKVKMLIPEEEVNARIEELGKKISEEYAGKQVHLVSISFEPGDDRTAALASL